MISIGYHFFGSKQTKSEQRVESGIITCQQCPQGISHCLLEQCIATAQAECPVISPYTTPGLAAVAHKYHVTLNGRYGVFGITVKR